jgi:hypothetical protein
VTAPARSYPQVPDAVRTERGPVATLTDDTRAAGRLVLASGKEDAPQVEPSSGGLCE